MAEATNEAAQTVPVMSIEELRSRVDANNAFLLAVRRAVHGRQIYGAICYDPHKLKIATRTAVAQRRDAGRSQHAVAARAGSPYQRQSRHPRLRRRSASLPPPAARKELPYITFLAFPINGKIVDRCPRWWTTPKGLQLLEFTVGEFRSLVVDRAGVRR